jgi:hypothetical protein
MLLEKKLGSVTGGTRSNLLWLKRSQDSPRRGQAVGADGGRERFPWVTGRCRYSPPPPPPWPRCDREWYGSERLGLEIASRDVQLGTAGQDW